MAWTCLVWKLKTKTCAISQMLAIRVCITEQSKAVKMIFSKKEKRSNFILHHCICWMVKTVSTGCYLLQTFSTCHTSQSNKNNWVPQEEFNHLGWLWLFLFYFEYRTIFSAECPNIVYLNIGEYFRHLTLCTFHYMQGVPKNVPFLLESVKKGVHFLHPLLVMG